MSQIRRRMAETMNHEPMNHSQRTTKYETRATSCEIRDTSDERRATINMQNKPNLPKGKIDAKCVFTEDYENKWQRRVRKNKPNSNPIKPTLQKAKMNVNLTLTKDYRKKDDFKVRKNKPNFSKGPK